MTGLRITPKPVGRGPRGKRGRRAAFYRRARMARWLQHLVRTIDAETHNDVMRAIADALTHGLGVVSTEARRPRPEDFDPTCDGRPALRVRHVSREEFEGEFYGRPPTT